MGEVDKILLLSPNPYYFSELFSRIYSIPPTYIASIEYRNLVHTILKSNNAKAIVYVETSKGEAPYKLLQRIHEITGKPVFVVDYKLRPQMGFYDKGNDKPKPIIEVFDALVEEFSSPQKWLDYKSQLEESFGVKINLYPGSYGNGVYCTHHGLLKYIKMEH